jgi:hypothetical protein
MIDERNSCVRIPRAEVIARLNDALRKRGEGGVIVVTRGVRCVPGFQPLELLKLLRDYDDFDTDNDPHGERDFGDIELAGETLFWKVDYYDADMLYGSPDPANAGLTQRVLTVMLPSEM